MRKFWLAFEAKDGITDTETRAEARISRQKELSWIRRHKMKCSEIMDVMQETGAGGLRL